MSKTDSAERKALQKEHMKVQRSFRLAGVASAIVLSCGATFYHLIEGLRWLDAFYFSMVTLATVGYGDISPKTDLGKLFTMFFMLVGIGIIGALANLLIKNASIKRQLNKPSQES